MRMLAALIIRMCVLATILCVTPSGQGFAQSSTGQRPFSSQDIIQLLAARVPEDEIITQVQRVKVNFTLETQLTATLVRAGASDALLAVINENYLSSLTILSPREGEQVGATSKIEGRAEQQPGKHLWVFSHREGLAVWWPQGGEVTVKSDGTWKHAVFLGQPQDIGLDFEIAVLWLDDQVDKQTKEYLSKGDATGHYPGIPLPTGEPRTIVTVAKTRH